MPFRVANGTVAVLFATRKRQARRVPLPTTIRTERLELHRWAPEHLDDVLSAIAQSWTELHPWMPWADEVPTADAQLDVLRAGRALFDAEETFEYFLFETATAELVGAVGVVRRGPDHAEIGYWVRSDRHRRGYATEATRALTRAGFDHLHEVISMEIHMDQANLASAAVARKAGYVLIGDEQRVQLAPGQTGVGWIWRATRDGWT